MERTFRFLNFKVYRDAKSFYREIVLITRKFPREHWELGDQIRRSALSVCLNIAEGSGKNSDKEFRRYLDNSLGSVNETAAGIDIAFDNGLIMEKMRDSLLKEAKEIADQLGGFSKKLKSR
jgi:four helix bundle protein